MVISISVALVYTVLSVMLTSMAGWALARYQFFGKGAVLVIILGTMTLPFFVVAIPQFIMVAREFKLANSWVALVVPPLFNSLGVLFMRQSFSMMPRELFDAAQVEGINEWQIFLRVLAHCPSDNGGSGNYLISSLMEQLSMAAYHQFTPGYDDSTSSNTGNEMAL